MSHGTSAGTDDLYITFHQPLEVTSMILGMCMLSIARSYNISYTGMSIIPCIIDSTEPCIIDSTENRICY